MKKILLGVACLLLLFTLVPSEGAVSPITVTVDGKSLEFDVPPMIVEGRTLVPLRAIFQALGADVDWNAATQTVSAVKGNRTVQLQIGSATAVVAGVAVTLDVPGRIIDGRTLVPLRFVGEALGAEVNWDGTARKVAIVSKGTPAAVPKDPSAAHHTQFQGWVWEAIVLTKGDAGANDHVADIDVVELPGGGYRGFFKASGIGIMSAVSQDGLRWKVEEGVRISGSVGDTFPRVVKFGDVYRMYFFSGNGIESAVSTNLFNWTREGICLAPDRNSEYERGGLEMGDIVSLRDGTYRLYYTGWTRERKPGSGQPSPESTVILSAISPDGLEWTREPGVRFQSQDYAVSHPKILTQEDGSWLMFYNTQFVPYQAVSKDGLIWRNEGPSGLFGSDVATLRLPDGSVRFYTGDYMPEFESRDGILGGYLMSSRAVSVPYKLEVVDWPANAMVPTRLRITGDSSVNVSVEAVWGSPWATGNRLSLSPASGTLPLEIQIQPEGPIRGVKPTLTIFISNGAETTYYSMSRPLPDRRQTQPTGTKG